MRPIYLRLVWLLPNTMVLAGAIDSQPAHAQQISTRDATADAVTGDSEPGSLKKQARRLNRFSSYLLEKENRVTQAQRQSLRVLGQLETRVQNLTRRLEKSPQSSRLSGLLNAAQSSIRAVSNVIQRREARIETIKTKRFISLLLEKENRITRAQRRSLRDLRELETRLQVLTRRLERSPQSARLLGLLDSTRSSIGAVSAVIQRRGARIEDLVDQGVRLFQKLDQIGPVEAGFRLIRRLISDQILAIERTRQFQVQLGVEPLPRSNTPTTDFPSGKPPASPVHV